MRLLTDCWGLVQHISVMPLWMMKRPLASNWHLIDEFVILSFSHCQLNSCLPQNSRRISFLSTSDELSLSVAFSNGHVIVLALQASPADLVCQTTTWRDGPMSLYYQYNKTSVAEILLRTVWSLLMQLFLTMQLSTCGNDVYSYN